MSSTEYKFSQHFNQLQKREDTLVCISPGIYAGVMIHHPSVEARLRAFSPLRL